MIDVILVSMAFSLGFFILSVIEARFIRQNKIFMTRESFTFINLAALVPFLNVLMCIGLFIEVVIKLLEMFFDDVWNRINR